MQSTVRRSYRKEYKATRSQTWMNVIIYIGYIYTLLVLVLTLIYVFETKEYIGLVALIGLLLYTAGEKYFNYYLASFLFVLLTMINLGSIINSLSLTSNTLSNILITIMGSTFVFVELIIIIIGIIIYKIEKKTPYVK